MEGKSDKVVVVGAGAVGSTFAYALEISGLANEIVLIDVDRRRAEGQAMDLGHGLPFVRPVRIHAGDYGDCADASVVVITAGVPRQPGQSRRDLAQRNDAILREIIPQVVRYNREGMLLIVSNPVDVLAYRAWQYSGLSQEQVIGSGTVLDTARFRYLIGEYFGIDVRNVHAYIVGEHGETELPLWSSARIAGLPLPDFCRLSGHEYRAQELEGIFAEVREAARRVIEYKGATYYAIGLALVAIIEAILRDQQTIIPISHLIEGEYGVSGVFLSLPTVIGRKRTKVVQVEMDGEEQEAFRRSAAALHEVIASLPPIDPVEKEVEG